MTELRKQINNIVEDHQACLVLANSIKTSEVYEGTTATASDILKGKTAYSNGKLIEGILEESYMVVSESEPIGEDRKKIWIKKGNNLANMVFFKKGIYVEGSGISYSSSGKDVTITTYWKNPWTATRFKGIDLRGLEGKQITCSLEVKENTSGDGEFWLGTCDKDIENRKELSGICFITKEDGRKSVTMTVPDTITETNQYLCICLYASGNSTPTVYNTYTTYTNIQIEIGSASEYKEYFHQELFILNYDGEYEMFDENTKF